MCNLNSSCIFAVNATTQLFGLNSRLCTLIFKKKKTVGCGAREFDLLLYSELRHKFLVACRFRLTSQQLVILVNLYNSKEV